MDPNSRLLMMGAGGALLSGSQPLTTAFSITSTQSVTFTLGWENDVTFEQGTPKTGGWSSIPVSTIYGMFISGIGTTIDDDLGHILTPVNYADRIPNSVSAPQGSEGGYDVNNANNFSTPNDGAWFNQAESRTLTATFNSGVGNAIGFVVQGFGTGGGYHRSLVITMTANGITRFMAPRGNIHVPQTTPSAPGGYAYYVTNKTSYSDFYNLGTITELPSSFFPS